jgi:hypothetical protein
LILKLFVIIGGGRRIYGRAAPPKLGGYAGGGGTLATAGGLVFHGGSAYNAKTDEKLRSVDLGGNVVTPISYMLDGKQHISVIARPQQNARVFTFVLDGTAPMPPTPPPPAYSKQVQEVGLRGASERVNSA